MNRTEEKNKDFKTQEKSIKPQMRQRLFLSSSADIVIYGGAAGGGKTFSLLMEPLYHIQNPQFSAVIFRRTYPQITVTGGLWDESCQIYSYVKPFPQMKPGNLSWHFHSGAVVSFRHMDRPEMEYQGAQIPLIGFDQLEQFSEHQFFFMMSRNRSTCGVKPYIRATANPQPGWLADFLSWWIAEDGYARTDRIGVIRWMGRVGNSVLWASSPQEWSEKYQPNVPDDSPEKINPKSVTFITASVWDNPALLDVNPDYLSSLMALPETERKRLLGDRHRGGNWHIRPGGIMFKREWFKIIDQAPAELMTTCRRWDMAATEEKKRKNPDFTAGALVGMKDGQWFIMDVRRGRLSPKSAEDLVRQTAVLDPDGTMVRMEQEPGSSGKTVIDHYARTVLVGFDFAGVPASGSKETNARPLAAAAERGDVFMVKAPWNSALLDELESFSPDCDHDDQVDACSGAFNDIAKRYNSPNVWAINSQNTPKGRMIAKIEEEVDKLMQELTPEERLLADSLFNGGDGRTGPHGPRPEAQE